jgi:hypothetical protein
MEGANDGDAATVRGKVSNGYAILIGTLWVNVPVFVIMFGGWIGIPWLAVHFFPKGPPLSTFVISLVLAAWVLIPFALAWTWWSFNVPRWRVWALARCADRAAFERDAIKSGLVWDESHPCGRLFARTEIWSRKHRARYKELLDAHAPVEKSETP